jgi:hypothetical protein
MSDKDKDKEPKKPDTTKPTLKDTTDLNNKDIDIKT